MIAKAITSVPHTCCFRFSPQYSPSHAARSLTARGRAKCPRRRARSFDEGVIVSRPNAVGRDGVVNLFALCKFCSFLLNADSWQPENNATNRNGRDCKSNYVRSSYLLFSVFPGVPPSHAARSLTARGPFLFRARFAARLRSRLGRLVCAFLRFRERPRTITADNLFATKSSQVARPILHSSVYPIGSLPTLIKLSIANQFMRILGTQKLTLRIATGTSESRMRPSLSCCFSVLRALPSNAANAGL